eukprot:979743-Pyramimonas_sp.AAC.1
MILAEEKCTRPSDAKSCPRRASARVGFGCRHRRSGSPGGRPELGGKQAGEGPPPSRRLGPLPTRVRSGMSPHRRTMGAE